MMELLKQAVKEQHLHIQTLQALIYLLVPLLIVDIHNNLQDMLPISVMSRVLLCILEILQFQQQP